MKGSVNLDFDPTHAPVGNLVKTKNSAYSYDHEITWKRNV